MTPVMGDFLDSAPEWPNCSTCSVNSNRHETRHLPAANPASALQTGPQGGEFLHCGIFSPSGHAEGVTTGECITSRGADCGSGRGISRCRVSWGCPPKGYQMVLQGGVMPGEAPRGLARETEMLLALAKVAATHVQVSADSAAAERLRAREFLAFLQSDLLLRSH